MPTNNPQKLELTWIGKDNRPRLEPRILIEDPEKTYRLCQISFALFLNLFLKLGNVHIHFL